MAPKTSEQLKQSLLVFFLVVSVTLVGLIWVDGLSEPKAETPAHFRSVPLFATPSAIAPQGTVEPRQHRRTPAPAAQDQTTPAILDIATVAAATPDAADP